MVTLRDQQTANKARLAAGMVSHLVSSTNSKVDSSGKKISFGILPHVTCPGRTQFCTGCYVSSSYRYPNVPKVLANNTATLFALQRGAADPVTEMSVLLDSMVKKSGATKAKTFRIHWSGDFFSQEYLGAWFEVAKNNPSIEFFTYTRCFHLSFKDKPVNLTIYASADSFNLQQAKAFSTAYNFPIAYAGRDTDVPTTFLPKLCPHQAGIKIDCVTCRRCVAGNEVYFRYHR